MNDKLTPREPTPEMVKAGHEYLPSAISDFVAKKIVLYIWRAMHEAAPAIKHPVLEEQVEPVLVVEVEPDYMSGGHFHKGTKPYIDATKVWELPIGTKLYTHPAAVNQELLEALQAFEQSNYDSRCVGAFVSAVRAALAEPSPEPLLRFGERRSERS